MITKTKGTLYNYDPDSYVWTDANGTEYQNNGDGTFTDYYGNRFTLVY